MVSHRSQVCLSRPAHPAIPVTPEQIAADAMQAVRAGAQELHLPVRRSDGTESLHPVDVADVLTRVRAVCPTAPLGISTSAAIVGDAAQRFQYVAAWTVLPDYVSVNIHEDGAFDLMRLCLDRGISVEAGLWHANAAEQFCASPLAESCLRILIEAHQTTLTAASANAAAIDMVLNRSYLTLPRFLHGLDESAWPLIDMALARSYAIRVGFEDMLHLPKGQPATSNAALISEAVRRRTSVSSAEP